MAKSRSQINTAAFDYNFADAGNGTIGTHTLPITFPDKSLFLFGLVFIQTTLVGAGAVLNFLCPNGNLHTGSNKPIADFSAGANVILNNFVINSASTNGYIILSLQPLQIDIGTAPITAGIIKYIVNYQSFS
jgi:hypothetical protein